LDIFKLKKPILGQSRTTNSTIIICLESRTLDLLNKEDYTFRSRS